MNPELRGHILNTLAYYDVMEFPLTSFEVWKHLFFLDKNGSRENGYSFWEVEAELKKIVHEKKLSESRGFYFLNKKDFLVDKRIEREKISSQKIKKAFKLASIIKFVPFVEFVGLAGRVAMKNSEERSDVDLLVILAPERMFLGRFLFTSVLHILGKRRHGKKISNRFCLNHFLTLGAEPEIQDKFSVHEYSFVLPIFVATGNEGAFEKAFGWIKKFKPHFFSEYNSPRGLTDTKNSLGAKKIFKFFLDRNFLEKFLGNWQKKKINANPKSKNEGGKILVSDNELAFWPEFSNQGPKIWKEFLERRKSLD